MYLSFHSTGSKFDDKISSDYCSAWLSWDWAPFPVSACVHLDLVKITWYFSEDVLHTFQKEHKLLFENSCTTFPKCNSVRCTYMQTRNQIMNLLYILDEVHTWLPKRVLCNICSLPQSKYCSSNKCLRWTRFLCRRAPPSFITLCICSSFHDILYYHVP